MEFAVSSFVKSLNNQFEQISEELQVLQRQWEFL